MKKIFLLGAVLIVFISAYSLVSFSQDDQAEKKLTLEKTLAEKIEILYKQAVSAYDRNEFKTADELFIKILKVDPEHKGANLYLYEKIPDKIAKDKLERQTILDELKRQQELTAKEPSRENVGLLYKKTVSLYDKGDLDKAEEFFKEILKSDPNHKGAKLYLEKKITDKKISSLYREAVSFYGNNELDKASSLFYEIIRLNPDHRPTQVYLREKIPEKLKAATLKEEAVTSEPIDQPEPAQTQPVLSEEEAARSKQFAKEEARMRQVIETYQAEPNSQEVKKEPELMLAEETSLLKKEKLPASGNIEREYRISPDDTLEISVYGEPEMKQTTRVSGEGKITYPFLGEITVKGFTSQEVEKKIEDLLSQDYFVDPQVNIIIKVYAKFNILGEIKRPGSYEISGPTTVIDAISIAGGFTDIANQNGVKVIRKEGDKTEVIKVPVKHILKTGDSSRNVYLQKGDTIVVPESFF